MSLPDTNNAGALRMTANPYSYVTNGGVHNTRVRVTEDDASLEQLVEEFKKPLQLDVTSIAYHNATKKERGNYKKVPTLWAAR
jgi:hypothetical protein